VLATVAVWLGVALLAGASGVVARLVPSGLPVVLFALTALLLAVTALPTPFRTFAASIDVRVLVLVHVTRFVGLYFLVLYGRGELPWAFAVPGGWGDVIVAAGALLLAAFVRPETAPGRRAYLAWNVVGLVDILGVVLTAARLALADPGSMRALLRLPLSLLPTFLVPIIVATHVVMLVRLVLRPGPRRPGAR
jgi:hypothetical protein